MIRLPAAARAEDARVYVQPDRPHGAWCGWQPDSRAAAKPRRRGCVGRQNAGSAGGRVADRLDGLGRRCPGSAHRTAICVRAGQAVVQSGRGLAVDHARLLPPTPRCPRAASLTRSPGWCWRPPSEAKPTQLTRGCSNAPSMPPLTNAAGACGLRPWTPYVQSHAELNEIGISVRVAHWVEMHANALVGILRRMRVARLAMRRSTCWPTPSAATSPGPRSWRASWSRPR